jgi:hypothetical protein
MAALRPKELSLKILLACLLAAMACASAATHAATAVNLQTCAVTPTAGGLVGCPTAQVNFSPVAPTTLVRSSVNGVQGWRAFSTLTPTDLVVAAPDFGWHALNTITVALQPPTTPTPPVTPPVTPPPIVLSNITLTVDGQTAFEPVVFMQLPGGSCFTLSDGVHTAHACMPQ